MQGNSAIYMGNDGHYRDKTEQQKREEAELAAAVPDGEPVPFDESGQIAGEEIVDQDGNAEGEVSGDGSGESLPEAAPKARTRKQ